VAPSFADIFRGNAISAGLVPAQVTEDGAARLATALAEKPDAEVVLDVAARTVSVGEEVTESFEISDYAQWRLLEGLDDVGLTLRHEAEIAAFEGTRPAWLPALGR
jgi:3-isopropylmalate/(R)-2-methylmalate dehydratase small subunit